MQVVALAFSRACALPKFSRAGGAALSTVARAKAMLSFDAGRGATITSIPLFTDNYAYCVTNASCESVVVDPADAAAVLGTVLLDESRPVRYLLAGVLTTHHHGDHAGGNVEIAAAVPGVPVIGGSVEDGKGSCKMARSLNSRVSSSLCCTRHAIRAATSATCSTAAMRRPACFRATRFSPLAAAVPLKELRRRCTAACAASRPCRPRREFSADTNTRSPTYTFAFLSSPTTRRPLRGWRSASA